GFLGFHQFPSNMVVLECHMEFLGTFGCIWSLKDVKQVIIGRAEHGSEVPQRRHEPRATCPERRTEVARISHPSRSDLPKRHPEVARVSMARRQEAKPGATSQSDPLKSLPKAGATCRSDMPRSLRSPEADYLLIFGSIEKYTRTLLRTNEHSSRHRACLELCLGLSSILDHPRSNPYTHEFSFPLVKKVEGLEGQEELCFINNNGSWYKKEHNFQYNNYQQKSYPNNQQSGYPPRNNQQGSYQPQQNPSSGSSAPQESSTDTLLKQILESQTRSEKQVGYELKNLHSKIDGSYNELNNKFSHLASTVLECHMEFLGTFGCIWSLKDVKQVIIGRAEHGSEVPQRRHESDLPKATHRGRSHLTPLSERPPKATPRGRSRLYGETTRSEARSDLSERPTEVAPEGRSDLSERHAEPPEADYLFFGSIEKYTRTLLRTNEHSSRHRACLELCLGLRLICFDIPQNWFDNLLYYNICLRSLENS
ncbi:hypothetical protein IGI04_003645, partial [Brassica rapa subsp. trilocularis]